MITFHKYFHWFYYHKGKSGLFNLGFGIFIWLFLVITQPFGIYENNVSDLMLVLLLMPIGFIWVLISLGFDWIGRIWLKLSLKDNHESDWWMWVIKLAFVINLTFIVRGSVCNWQCVDWLEYLQSWLAFLLMFSFFYLPFTFYAKYKFFHSMVGARDVIGNEMVLLGDTKESIAVNPDELVYLQADDNYVILWANRSEDELSKSYLRATLKSVEEQLREKSEFIRIHRSFIINTKFFTGYKKGQSTITIKSEIELPVSRKYKDRVAAVFIHPK